MCLDHRTAVRLFGLLYIYLFVATISSSPQDAPTSAPSAAASGNSDKELGSVAGTVLSAATGEPLKKADISLSRERQQDRQPLAATTDAAGHFSIDHVPAGRYALAINRAGYVPQTYGQSQPDAPPAILTIAPAEKISDLIFRLQRTAVITGVVRDGDGEPVANLNVEVLDRVVRRGKQITMVMSTGNTNDLGEYRIFNLRPGQYSVRVNPRGIFDMSAADESPRPPTYYPGTPDPARASVIDLQPGDEIAGIDFVLSEDAGVRTYKIRGRVSNAITGRLDSRIVVSIVSRDDDPQPFGMQQVVPKGETGDFEIKGIPAGSYTVTAMFFNADGMHGSSQDVDVVNADVEGIYLTITKGVNISGRVSFEGSGAATMHDIRVNLRPKDRFNWILAGREQTVVDMDGSFVWKGVTDGEYEISASSNCATCYLKSATAEGVDLLEKGVIVKSGSGPSEIELIYSSKTGGVDGTVARPDALPAVGAIVTVVPEPADNLEARRVRDATTDQYGRFEIRGVPPGKYRVFAFEKIDRGAYEDDSFLKPIEDKGEAVEISGIETKTVQLKLISPDAAKNQQ